MDVELLEDAHHLHGDRAAGSVVGGAGAVVPRVEVAADHDDLIFLRPAGDLRDDVERIGVGGVPLRLDVELQLHRHIVLQQARDAVVMLGRNRNLRDVGVFLAVLRAAAEQGAALGAGVRLDRHRGLFLLPVGGQLLPEGAELFERHVAGQGAAPSASSASAAGWDQLGREFRQLFRRIPRSQRSGREGQLRRRHGQHDLAFQFAVELLHVSGSLHDGQDGVAGDRAIGAGRPGHRNADDRLVGGFHHRPVVIGVFPAGNPGRPLLEVDLIETPLVQLLDGPIARGAELRRIHQPRAVAVGEIVHHVHDLGVLKLLGLDAVDHVQVDFFLRVGKRG